MALKGDQSGSVPNRIISDGAAGTSINNIKWWGENKIQNETLMYSSGLKLDNQLYTYHRNS